jgi:preprotein translocase subunit SecG
MLFLKALLIVLLALSSLLLIGLILLQKSKSEGLGLAFGASTGESLFGARAGNVLSKATVFLGVVFMASALFLGVLFAQQDKSLMDDVDSEPAPAPVVQTEPMQMDLGTPPVEVPAEQ